MVDNLFLMRNIFDVCILYNINVGITSIDQEKAFDHADHSFFICYTAGFCRWRALLSCVKLLYSGTCCVVKGGGFEQTCTS